MGEVVLTLLLKILLRLTQETKNLAKDTEKCLIFCREAVILFFFPGKSTVFRIKVLTPLNNVYPKA